MFKLNRISWIAVAVVITGLSLTGCKKNASSSSSQSSAAQGGALLIGEVGSMTGPEATFGMSTHQGILLATKEFNAAGGIKGKQIEVKSLDDQGKPEEAATATTKLVVEDKVSAVLGEVASSRSKAMAPVAQQYHVPMITPSSTNPEVTQLGDYIFRVCFIDPFQGYVMAKFALENLKIKKVAVLTDVKNDYSVGLAKFFVDTFTKGGGQIIMKQSYGSNDIDFKSQLTAIRAKNPEAIYVPGYYTDVGLIARQARELGITVPLMGGDGWDSPKLKEIGGSAIDGCYFSNHYTPENKAPRVQDFIKNFKAAYGVIPDGLAAMGYDAAGVLYEAMKRSKDETGAELRNQIAATKDFDGVTGKISIDKDRNAVKSAVVIKIENGDFHYQTTVTP
jgi:branched-chain amino acid transport system substrate-binding protein